jgi:glycosyltransferase involved in cell wall biosynthesis
MKIIHLVDSLERGGQEVFLVNLAACQVKSGHDVTIICSTSAGVLEGKAKQLGVRVNASLVDIKNTFTKLVKLYSIVSEIKPELIHTHNRQPLIYAVFSLSFLRSRIINTRHGDNVRGLNWSLSAIFSYKIVNVSAELFQSSNFVNRNLFKFKNIVIHNGIPIKKSLSSGKNIGNMIMVGRLSAVKNYDYALEIVQQCKLKGTRLHLNIIGDGPEKVRLQEMVSKQGLNSEITFLGDRDDVHKLLCESDIFLMTSTSEGHSIALLEAVAAGLPCLVSDVGGNSEIITDGYNGYVIKLENLNGFVESLARLMSDRSLWSVFSENSRAWALKNTSIDKCAENYLALIEK